jgi:hypothetical protein
MDRSNFIDRAIASALVTEVLMSGADVDRRETVNCEKNHIWPTIFSASAGMAAAQFNPDAAAASQGPRRRALLLYAMKTPHQLPFFGKGLTAEHQKSK